MHTTTWSRLTDLPNGHRDIFADLDKRYKRTYLLRENKEVVYYYENYDDRNIVMKPRKGGSYLLSNVDVTDIKPFLPKVGYYNLPTGPVYLIKSPDRQWKRSFSPNIYQILGATRDDLAHIPQSGWWDIAEQSLNPSYAHMDHISIELFANVAISPNFAVQKVNNKPTLIYRQLPVAVLDFNKRTVIVTHKTFQQEILDLFKYTGIVTWNIQ